MVKLQAIATKLQAITTKMGYPNRWPDYSSVEIKRDDAVGNGHPRKLLDVFAQRWGTFGVPSTFGTEPKRGAAVSRYPRRWPADEALAKRRVAKRVESAKVCTD